MRVIVVGATGTIGKTSWRRFVEVLDARNF